MILLCSDYDGTLHFKNKNDSGYFKPEDLKEIKIFQEKGNLFSLCTGRIIDTIQDDLIKNMNMVYMKKRLEKLFPIRNVNYMKILWMIYLLSYNLI